MKRLHRLLHTLPALALFLLLGPGPGRPTPASAASTAPADRTRPNIVVLMTDDQGYGELGCHGNPILRTPHLDRLHADSARFVDFTVSPTCAPTRAALLTGRHEFRSGVTHTIYERERLSLDAITLPQLLRNAGYTTAIVGKWHLGDEPDRQPHRRGFEETFIHGAGGIGQTYPGSGGDAPGNSYFDPAILHNGQFVQTHGYCTDVFFRHALAWIDSHTNRARPFFLWLTPNAPHDPFISPGPDYEREFADRGLGTNAVRYYSMIRNLDDNVGRLLDHLRERDLDRSTLVIFLTDNGHSVPGLFNDGMRGNKGSPYRGGTRVPSFWRWTGRFTPGDRTQTAAHLDLLPTLTELAGIRLPREVRRRLEGISLVPALRDPQARWPERRLITHVGRWDSGRMEDWKYRGCAIREGRFKLVNNSELFDLATDPAESVNLAESRPDVVRRLRRYYERWWSEIIPATRENDLAHGPAVNPFKALYWQQFGGSADATLRQRMDPDLKFAPRSPSR